MKFSQHIVVDATDEDALLNLVRDGSGAPPAGVLAMRLLRFRDKPNRYVIQVDFDSWESAERSNSRPETQVWARRLADMIEGQPKYEDLNVVYERH